MTQRNYGLIRTVDELLNFFDRLTQSDGPIGFDIETGYLGPDREKFSLHPETAILAGFSFTNSPHWARYVPLAHDIGENLTDHQTVASLLWRLLATGRAVIHNAPFELRHLSRWFRQQLGDAVAETDGYFPFRSCTQVEAYLAAEYQEFGLKHLVKEIFGHEMTELHELFPDLPKNKRKMLRFNVLDPSDPKVYEYACEDSAWALSLHEHYYDRVKDRLLYKAEMGVLSCICEMEDVGVRYDWGLMRRTAEELKAFRDRWNGEIMSRLSDLVGEPVAINLASPKQLGEMLYGRLGMKTTVYTEKTKDLPADQRKMSTGAIALAGLAKQHPVVKMILQWKEQTRLLGTYLEKYEGVYGYAEDGNTHPNHMSAVVVTGRFAVADPPYQQSPKVYHYDLQGAVDAHERHAVAHGDKCVCDAAEFAPPPGTCFRFNFRDCIIAPPDHYILGFDLSQAELRVIAGEAQETALLRAFESNQDVHRITAGLMLGVPVEQVTKEQRDIGKTMNFALLYGMSPKGLADRLALSLSDAEALYDKYFSAFSSIAVWSERQVAKAKATGHVMSRFGRILPIWEYQSDKHWIRSKGDRAAVNYPVQGGATGCYMKLSMVRARAAIRNAGLNDRVHMVMNVHDALGFYVHRSVKPETVIALLQPAVVFPVPGWPPMAAEWHIAKRWGSPTEVELGPDGQLIVKGEHEAEAVPTVEVDEETGEEVLVLPEVDTAALVAAVHNTMAVAEVQAAFSEPERVNPPAPDGKQVIVTLPDMPDEPSYRRFLDLLTESPGPNRLTVRTPEGDMDFDVGTSLSPVDGSVIRMIFPDADVVYSAEDVDLGQVVAGLSF